MKHVRFVSALLCAALLSAAAPTLTVTSNAALVGWASGPLVATEFSFERQLIATYKRPNIYGRRKSRSADPRERDCGSAIV
jgi:hypothetical protein